MILTTFSIDANDVDDHKPSKSQYTSKKEILTIIAILVVLGILSTPVFKGFKDQRNKVVCNANMKAIYDAMMQYATMNSDQLPPIYHVGDNGAPFLSGPENKPYVWASVLQPYMTVHKDFYCPAAEEDEKMHTRGSGVRDGDDFDLTYGMYLAMSAKPHLLLSRPKDTILFAETSNNGAQGSFNPTPFLDLDGNVVPYDAFMIGYDDSNFNVTPASKWVTRLAFRGVSKGYVAPNTKARHARGIHVTYADGHRGILSPADAEVDRLGSDLNHLWRDH